MNGVIVLNKPQGKTSHDMVYFIRRLLGVRRVGHTGTLDPNATGVLPICVGNATKAADYIQNSNKKYTAELILGSRTDTLDCTGSVLERGNASQIAYEQLKNQCAAFIGTITQLPPMYSAVKVGGKKLYELAREGKSVERKLREVSIYSLKVTKYDANIQRAILEVECSKGTYIRTLCDDIGERLGCYAHMGELTRTYSGGFNIEKSYTPEQLEELCREGMLDNALIKTEDIYRQYDKIFLTEAESFKAKNGVPLKREDTADGKYYRVYDSNGDFLCISQEIEGLLRLKTSFWT